MLKLNMNKHIRSEMFNFMYLQQKSQSPSPKLNTRTQLSPDSSFLLSPGNMSPKTQLETEELVNETLSRHDFLNSTMKRY